MSPATVLSEKRRTVEVTITHHLVDVTLSVSTRAIAGLGRADPSLAVKCIAAGSCWESNRDDAHILASWHEGFRDIPAKKLARIEMARRKRTWVKLTFTEPVWGFIQSYAALCKTTPAAWCLSCLEYRSRVERGENQDSTMPGQRSLFLEVVRGVERASAV